MFCTWKVCPTVCCQTKLRADFVLFTVLIKAWTGKLYVAFHSKRFCVLKPEDSSDDFDGINPGTSSMPFCFLIFCLCVTCYLQPGADYQLEERGRGLVRKESGREQSQWRSGDPVLPNGRRRGVRVCGRKQQREELGERKAVFLRLVGGRFYPFVDRKRTFLQTAFLSRHIDP